MTRTHRRLLPVLILSFTACSDSGPTSPTAPTDNGGGASTTPAVYAKFTATVDASMSGSTVVLRTDDLPNHPSPYYGAGSSLYVAPPVGMVVNPNRIMAQNYEFRIPIQPAVASRSTATALDAIGIATNGVVMFNQYAAGFSPLDNERATFDQYNGHPAGRGNYHYHIDPVALTATDPAALVGVLLDGFPVYGRVDMDGTTPTDLDECNGHTTATRDYPEGRYHYHITESFPYISGCYRGSPGTVTN